MMFLVDIDFRTLLLSLPPAYGKLLNVSEPLAFCKIIIVTYLTEVLRLSKAILLQCPLTKTLCIL